MAIMQSCCCWRSVRRGSIACAIYTGLYFALTTVMTTNLLDQERQYLAGNRSAPQSLSFLEHETISPTTVRFNIVILSCSSCGVLSSLLLLYGLFKDQRVLLIPWILTVITFSVVDITHSLYVCVMASVPFNPITAMLFTLDFFVLCLNVYSLLCVISQYQEYLAGRGTAADDCEYRAPAVRYAVQPTTTATSCLSSRRAPTNNETRATSTPTQSPTAIPATLATDKSPVACKPARKHVQFPDTPMAKQGEKFEMATLDALPTWSTEVELCKTPSQLIPAVVDTAPLLSSPMQRQGVPPRPQKEEEGEKEEEEEDKKGVEEEESSKTRTTIQQHRILYEGPNWQNYSLQTKIFTKRKLYLCIIYLPLHPSLPAVSMILIFIERLSDSTLCALIQNFCYAVSGHSPYDIFQLSDFICG